MDPWTLMAISSLAGAGLGAMKYGEDKKTEKADRAAAAEAIRYSPWTGMQPGQIREANLMNNMMQGATGLGMLGLNIGQAGAKNDLLKAQTQAMQANSALGYPGPTNMAGAAAPMAAPTMGFGATPYNQTFNAGQYLG